VPKYEYVVVGSGAGGGTLAARLAEAGCSVLLLEAGGDPRQLRGGDPLYPDANRLPDDYDVPCFHGFAAESEAMKWDFFVRHYADDALQRRDDKYCIRSPEGKVVDGVLYPRAGVLGGCTAHNAQILVYPHDEDWDGLAKLTGDPSWSAGSMRRYFERLENCHHRLPYRWLSMLGFNPTRHGWKGWLQTEKAIPVDAALGDTSLVQVILRSVDKAFRDVGTPVKRVRWLFQSQADPNDWRLVKANGVGLRYIPLTTRGHQRSATRERVLDTARRLPNNLVVELNALATRVIFDKDNPDLAIGVEYLKGERLYRAHGHPNDGNGQQCFARASREVVLSGGAFNTPQLLMLSGIGPRAVLEKYQIPVVIDLPSVGKNLQDRYEVGVVNQVRENPWAILKDAKFSAGDPQYQQWAERRSGVYTTNGAVLGVILRSAAERPLPDLLCFALLGKFRGYFPGFSTLFAQNLNYLTWAILKGHTNNRAGEVTLQSSDPRDVPHINFRYFDEGSDSSGEDLASVVDGIKFVRKLTRKLKEDGVIVKEELPGDDVNTDADLRDFVRYNAWGHHASCTCPIGAITDGGVLTSDFRVHGTRGLRVVDASVFPRIPGLFVVSAVYMIGEKAADVILADRARSLRGDGAVPPN
jgi:choline dehydrogenase-like flavoprotein